MDKTRIAILGASGYAGGELVRLLSHHPAADIVLLTAERQAGKPLGAVFPGLGSDDLPQLMALDEVEWAGLDVDVVFCALPHATTQTIVRGLFHASGHSFVDEMIVETTEDLIASIARPVKVIDLSADFRLGDPAVYKQWYGEDHRAPELQNIAVYGLSEINREAIAEASLVANPGCYPTTALLPLIPLLAADLVAPQNIVIDAKSGVSGAGRAAREANLFAEVSEGIRAYGLQGHRHTPEIEQELTAAAGAEVAVSFTPHLVPMNRGILETIYVQLTEGATMAQLRDALDDSYRDEPFVQLLPEGVVPDTRQVRGANRCLINVFAGRRDGTAVIVSVIDNLVKGAAGQAIQNMNLILGLPETTGLDHQPLFL
ncbi:MAG: N-acetyl-gamma-glutamyl-phosphate reductase [Sphingomonadales bacterium]